MSGFEDLGFQSFTRSVDVTGAVDVEVSGKEIALGVGAIAAMVVGAVVYGPLTPFESLPQVPWKVGPVTEGVEDIPQGMVAAVVAGELPSLRIAVSPEEKKAIFNEAPLDPESRMGIIDQKLRLLGLAPAPLARHGDHVYYERTIPVLCMSPMEAERIMRGESMEGVDLSDYFAMSDHDAFARMGLGPAGAARLPTWHGDLAEVEYYPVQCMLHPECREHPEIGRACLMEQWDRKWNEG